MPESRGTIIDLTEDPVQSISQTEPLPCQVCSTSLQKLSLEQRQAHYEGHFPDSQPGSSLSASANPVSPKPNQRSMNINSNSPSSRNGNKPPVKENVFWFQARSTKPPENFTPGLIPILKRALTKTHAKGLTIRAMLCHEGATHVATEYWDMGWGCGYRNFLMACTALLNQSFQPLYFPLLDAPIPPGVRNLQYWIEDAWAEGFDKEGAEDLRHKLVGTKKWIGTAELYVAFVSRGIPAKLVDFPKSGRGPNAVTEWIMAYFSPPPERKQAINAFNALKGASPVASTNRMPLILQHSGHSRTVVGFEVNKKGEHNLLVFDPSRRPSKEIRRAALEKSSVFFSSNPAAKTDQKRCSSDSTVNVDPRKVKRIKRSFENPSPDLDHKVIVVDDDSGDNDTLQETLDPTKVVNFFRVSQNKLGKKDRYQILYFPLDPPLDDTERWARRVVTSEMVE